MTLQDHIISVLRGHGGTRKYKGFDFTVELVKIYLTDSVDTLPSALFEAVAAKHGIQRYSMVATLRTFAYRLRELDPEWGRQAIREPFDAVGYISAVAEESLARYRAHFDT